MNKRLLYLAIAAFALTGCAKASVQVIAEEPEQVPVRLAAPNLKQMLESQNVNGYTKKTTINETVCASEELFHAKCNGSQRATYYNAEETALLMGDYAGGFTNINSGYRNLTGEDKGIQHFRYNGEGDYFTAVTDDWSYLGQTVGEYYPTLTSLSNLINQDTDWDYADEKFTYNKSDETLFKNFQFFAAPMLLEGTIEWKTINIKLVESALSIELVDTGDVIVSTAVITQGY